MRATDVLPLYAAAPLPVRAFLKGRLLLSDLDRVEALVPRSGTVADLGCGHGLFANYMALSAPGRDVTGIDLSREKIAHATATVGRRTNIRFLCGDIIGAELPPVDAVTIVDVTYLMPVEEQFSLLKAAYAASKPGGTLVWKAQEQRPRWKYAITYTQELAATAAGLTEGKRGGLYFLSREEAASLLGKAGFYPEIVEMPTRRPYTDILYIGKK
mgnify:CR=1 FL=1